MSVIFFSTHPLNFLIKYAFYSNKICSSKVRRLGLFEHTVCIEFDVID